MLADDSPRRILIATDAWHPQVNGVVRTLDTTVHHLRARGHHLRVIHPGEFCTLPFPAYPEIRVALPPPDRIREHIRKFRPDHVHIATEGMIGVSVRRVCRKLGWAFTTSYHTRFPEYLHQLIGFPSRWTYRFLRWFHGAASAMMVSTPSLEAELLSRGFQTPIRRWSRGVDLDLFHPRPQVHERTPLPRPVLLYVGRVSHEKNVEAFLRLRCPGTKVVVGDGPAREELERRYPSVRFWGYRRGEALAEAYAAADLFVFPSLTDTFGLVIVEALASGLPVAAYPVTGPKDILTAPPLGALDEDLERAVARALAQGNPATCVEHARRYSWDTCTRQFFSHLVPVRSQASKKLRQSANISWRVPA